MRSIWSTPERESVRTFAEREIMTSLAAKTLGYQA